MAKLMAPNIRIDWYPEGHFADVENPTVDELNSGTNLSCAVVTGYTLDFTDSNTVTTTTVFDNFESEAISTHSYEANLQFFLAPRDSIAGNEEAFRKAEELFYVDQNPKGYLAKRFGFPGDSKYVGNQKVDLFLLQADLPKVLSEEDKPVLLNIRFLPQGEAVSGVTVVGQLVKVTAVEPTWKDSPNPYLKGGGTWSTPAVEGVIYDRPSGTAKGGETVTVSARPKTGYEITGSTSWSHTFPEKLPWVSYEWEGEPHASESIKKIVGVEVARNRVTDPSFATGSLSEFGSNSGVEGLEVVEKGDLFPWLGVDHVARFRGTGSSTSAYTYLRVYGITPGRWYAIRASIKGPDGETARLQMQFRQGSSTTLSTGDTDDNPPPAGRDYTVVSQAPEGTDSMRFLIWPPASPNIQDYTYFGGLMIAVADSEQEALDQVAEYFDGDTPDVYL